MAKRKGKRSRTKTTRVPLAMIGAGANAAYQLQFPAAIRTAMNGDFEGAFNTIGQAANVTNVLQAAGPIVGLGLLKKITGPISLFKMGRINITLL